MSFNEYFTHRWYQHAEFNKKDFWMQKLASAVSGREKVVVTGGGHVEHHAETYDDMTLKKDDRWRKTVAAASLDSDRFRGTAFTWTTTGIMTIQMLFTTLPVFMGILGLSLPLTMAFLLPAMLAHASFWNALHPPMHGLGEVPASVGAPSKWMTWVSRAALHTPSRPLALSPCFPLFLEPSGDSYAHTHRLRVSLHRCV
jgi:hypothetical protein